MSWVVLWLGNRLTDGPVQEGKAKAKLQQCCRMVELFQKGRHLENQKRNKAFWKRAENSHASETPDGHRTVVGGTSWEGPPLMGPMKPSGGAPNRGERLKVKNVPEGPFRVERPVLDWLVRFIQTDHLSDIIMMS